MTISDLRERSICQQKPDHAGWGTSRWEGSIDSKCRPFVQEVSGEEREREVVDCEKCRSVAERKERRRWGDGMGRDSGQL